MALSNRRFNVVDPEDQAALQATLEYEVGLLIKPLAKFQASDLERLYSEYSSRADRNYEAEQIVHARLAVKFPKASVLFTADCPETGHCRFQMRVTRRPEDMHIAEPVFYDHGLNFMKPHHEWHKPPEAK